MQYIKNGLLFLAIFIALVFFSQNNETLSQTLVLRFSVMIKAWKSIPLPLYFIILLSFLTGGLLATAYLFLDRLRMSKSLKNAKKEQTVLEKELNSLRNLPLEDKVFTSSSSSSTVSQDSMSNTLHDAEVSNKSANGE